MAEQAGRCADLRATSGQRVVECHDHTVGGGHGAAGAILFLLFAVPFVIWLVVQDHPLSPPP